MGIGRARGLARDAMHRCMRYVPVVGQIVTLIVLLGFGGIFLLVAMYGVAGTGIAIVE